MYIYKNKTSGSVAPQFTFNVSTDSGKVWLIMLTTSLVVGKKVHVFGLGQRLNHDGSSYEEVKKVALKRD